MSFLTPLRYPGGKGRLGSYFVSLLENSGLRGVDYVEPYAGGAGVALHLLENGVVRSIHLNDLDYTVYAFWYAVLFEPDCLMQKIHDTKITIEEWHKQKEIRKYAEHHSILDVGFSTFFLNRTNRSGILDGGVIGGKNQSGKWRLDVRFNKLDMISRIQQIASKSSRIKLWNCDAADLLLGVESKLNGENTFIYLDPPYFQKGKQLYKNHYRLVDHSKISWIVQSKLKCHWVVSYDDVPEINSLYSRCSSKKITLSYTAGAKKKGTEVFFYSNHFSKLL